jgi:hypothetical protein
MQRISEENEEDTLTQLEALKLKQRLLEIDLEKKPKADGCSQTVIVK